MSGSSLKAISRELILKNAPKIFLVSIFYVILMSGLSWFATRLPGTVDFNYMYERISSGEMPGITLIYRDFRPFGVVLALTISLIQPVLDAGYMSYCMSIGRKQDADYKDVLNGFQYFFKVLTIFLISTLFIMLWSMLFVIPGVVAAYKYRLAYYIMFDDPDKSALQCITESKLMMHGHKVDLLIIDISFLGWYLLDYAIVALTPAAFMPRILMVWIAPYRGLVNAGFYDDCKSSIAV